MKTVFVIGCVAAIFILSLSFKPEPQLNENVVKKIYEQTVSPNTVSGVYLNTRLYDTLFEVLVFSVASIGVKIKSKSLKIAPERSHISDKSAIVGIKLLAFLSILAGFYLAIFGHLSPGGGFAAGVAGATGLLLIATTSGFEDLENYLKKKKAESIETLLIVAFLLVATIDLLMIHFPKINGKVLEGQYIPIYNVLIFAKVSLGGWIIVYNFIRHRGVL